MMCFVSCRTRTDLVAETSGEDHMEAVTRTTHIFLWELSQSKGAQKRSFPACTFTDVNSGLGSLNKPLPSPTMTSFRRIWWFSVARDKERRRLTHGILSSH